MPEALLPTSYQYYYENLFFRDPEIIGFRNWCGGPVGHPQGAQVKTLIFNMKYLPKVSHEDLEAKKW